MLNSNIVEINDEQAQKAQVLSSVLSEANIRKKATIDILGISCAINYLNCEQIRTETKRSAFKIPKLFEEFKLTDIYYNNYRIDVITVYREKTVKIPKIHAEYEILPDFYFIVQIGSKIKEAKIIGFIDGTKITSSPRDSKYYYPALNLIFDIEKFKNITRRPKVVKAPLGKHSEFHGLFLKFIDNDLSSVYKKQLIQHLMNCDTCRANFIDVTEFERIALNVSHHPDLIEKYSSQIKIENTDTKEIPIQSKFDELEYENEKINKKMKEKEKAQELAAIKAAKLAIKNSKKSIEVQKEIPIEHDEVNSDPDESTKVIEEIFDEIPKIELPPLKTLITSKNKRNLIIFTAIFIVLGLFALISIKGSSEKMAESDGSQMAEYNKLSDEYYDDFYASETPAPRQAQLITRKNNIDDFTIKQPVSTKPAYSPTITNISWEAPESLVKKANYTKFLQLTGKNIKLNLQNDLLLVNDIPTNKQIKVDIKIASNGEVQQVKLIKNSGSEQIDNSIKKVVQDTLKYMKPPSTGVMSRSVDVTLSVELY